MFWQSSRKQHSAKITPIAEVIGDGELLVINETNGQVYGKTVMSPEEIFSRSSDSSQEKTKSSKLATIFEKSINAVIKGEDATIFPGSCSKF